MSTVIQPLPDVRPHAPLPDGARIVADGKFLQVGGERFLIKGVTYGTFAPDADGKVHAAANVSAVQAAPDSDQVIIIHDSTPPAKTAAPVSESK